MDWIDILLQPDLLLFTVPVLLSVSTWLLALFGLFDFHKFDLDIETNPDSEMEVDSGQMANGLMRLMGVGLVPFSLILTLLLCFFGGSGLALHGVLFETLRDMGWTMWQMNFAFAPAALLLGAGVSGSVSRLLSPLFEELRAAEGGLNLIGKVGVLQTEQISPFVGVSSIQLGGGLLEVPTRTLDEASELTFGDEVVITDYDRTKNLYYVEPLERED